MDFSSLKHLSGVTIKSTYPIYQFRVLWYMNNSQSFDYKTVDFDPAYSDSYTYTITINADNVNQVVIYPRKVAPSNMAQMYYIYPRFDLRVGR